MGDLPGQQAHPDLGPVHHVSFTDPRVHHPVYTRVSCFLNAKRSGELMRWSSVVSRGSNESLENFIIGLLVNLVFVVDTVLIFFKAYVDGDGKLVVFRSTIARRYLTSWFVVDVLACFPSDVILYAT